MAHTLLNWIEVGVLVGLLYAPVTIGLAWAFRVVNYPDLTCEGSFIFGGAVSIVMLNATGSVTVAFLAAVLAGAFAGMLTAAFHVCFRVSRLLSGIITWAILYSVTIRLLGEVSNLRAHIPTLFQTFNRHNSGFVELVIAAAVALMAVCGAIILSLLRWGRLTRAAGDQKWFVSALGVSPAAIVVIGLGVANALIALAGAVVCQQRGVCDVNMGTGVLVAGLAAMVLGEAVWGARKVWQHMLMVIVGTIVYNMAISAFYFDWHIGVGNVFIASDVRLVSGVLLLVPAALVAKRRGRYRLYASEW